MSQQPRVRLTKKAAKKTTHKRISPAPQPIEPDAYYDAQQLAARYGLHEVTLWKWAREGKIPRPIKLGPNTSRWHGAALIAHERKLQASGEDE